MGGRDEPGHDGMEGGGPLRIRRALPRPISLRPLHRHARACPGHPRRPALLRGLVPGEGPPGPGAARRGVGGRDEPGHDGREGGDRFGSAVPSLDRAFIAPSTVMPGLVPGTHAGPRRCGFSGRAGARPGPGRKFGTTGIWHLCGAGSGDIEPASPPLTERRQISRTSFGVFVRSGGYRSQSVSCRVAWGHSSVGRALQWH